jgi:hypothetical protein
VPKADIVLWPLGTHLKVPKLPNDRRQMVSF